MLFHLGIIHAHLMRWPSPKSACPASDLDGQTSGRKTPGTPGPQSAGTYFTQPFSVLAFKKLRKSSFRSSSRFA